MIRGAYYRVDFGDANRGHEQRGLRYGLVVSPSEMLWSIATVIPTSTSARPSIYRPEVEVLGTRTRLVVDQIRSIDTRYITGDPVDFLESDELLDVERSVAHYLGL